MIRKFGIFFISTGLLTLSFLASALALDESAIKVKWGYKGNIGPEKWPELSTAFKLCGSGKMQSPVDITDKVRISLNKLKINYVAAPLEVINDGATELTIGKHQLMTNEGHAIQVNFPQNTDESITFNDKTYKLLQFHIHTPSENSWHGEFFPMEIHFVHQGEKGAVAVLAVFAKTGETENNEIKTLITHLPTDKNKAHEIKGKSIDPSRLLPEQLDYYSLEGSLTSPPCDEPLQWIILAAPITVTSAQVLQLKNVMGGNNARPIQSLNNRKIFYTN